MPRKDGRFRSGNNRAATLTERDVLDIRRMWARRESTQAEMSRRFGVTGAQIGRICRGESWQHVKPPLNDEDIAKAMREFQACVDTEAPVLTQEEIDKLKADLAPKTETKREDPIEKYFPRTK